jgi:polar amino acid transport system substrate-binding protein
MPRSVRTLADLHTIKPGALVVASAFPDPPFEVEQDGAYTGFDAELMQTICARLGLEWMLVLYNGEDFNGILDGLREGRRDVVISGTTITPERRKVARFSQPYLHAGQSLVVNTARTPQIRSTDDLAGQVVGIQRGNTSDAVARELLRRGALGEIRYYPYHAIFDDLAVVQKIATQEDLGIAVALGNDTLGGAIEESLGALRTDGTIASLKRKWLGEVGA